MHQQPGKLPEFRAFRIGPAALGDFTRGVRDRRRRHLEQLGDRIAHACGRRTARAADFADGFFDTFEEVGQRRQVIQRRETAQRLQRLKDLLERVMRHRIAAERAAGAIERARDRRALAGNERACTGIEPNGLSGANLSRGTAAELLELAGQRFGLRRVGVGPRRGLANENLEIVHGTNGQLFCRRVPGPPPLPHAPRERLESHGRTRDALLACHQRAAP